MEGDGEGSTGKSHGESRGKILPSLCHHLQEILGEGAWVEPSSEVEQYSNQRTGLLVSHRLPDGVEKT